MKAEVQILNFRTKKPEFLKLKKRTNLINLFTDSIFGYYLLILPGNSLMYQFHC